MKYSIVKVIRNEILNETVASAYLDTDSETEVADYIARAKKDYAGSGCSAKITVSVYVGPNQDYQRIETVLINETG